MNRGGTLRFRIMEGDAPELPAEIPRGDNVVLQVSDTGSGMPPEVRSKIFEPFFTTKAKGRGTGLGLAMAYGIVQAHQGTIVCDSSPGRGTVFTLSFPRLDTSLENESTHEVPEGKQSGAGCSVLVAEDEDYIREIMAETLLACDFTVLEAGNGRQALDLFRQRGREVRLLVLDLNMPVMGGADCLREIRAIDPDVRVIISTGSSDMMGLDLDGDDPVKILRKPYTPAELLDKVWKTLADRD
jgi:CheY-like chemotaxis protein